VVKVLAPLTIEQEQLDAGLDMLEARSRKFTARQRGRLKE
jgi:4-aminobutyrate aminotransferase-like enzyme